MFGEIDVQQLSLQECCTLKSVDKSIGIAPGYIFVCKDLTRAELGLIVNNIFV